MPSWLYAAGSRACFDQCFEGGWTDPHGTAELDGRQGAVRRPSPYRAKADLEPVRHLLDGEKAEAIRVDRVRCGAITPTLAGVTRSGERGQVR